MINLKEIEEKVIKRINSMTQEEVEKMFGAETKYYEIIGMHSVVGVCSDEAEDWVWDYVNKRPHVLLGEITKEQFEKWSKNQQWWEPISTIRHKVIIHKTYSLKQVAGPRPTDLKGTCEPDGTCHCGQPGYMRGYGPCTVLECDDCYANREPLDSLIS